MTVVSKAIPGTQADKHLRMIYQPGVKDLEDGWRLPLGIGL